MTNHEKMTALKKELGLSNADLAEILELTEGSVKTLLAPSNKQGFPTWAKALLYGYERGKENMVSAPITND